MALLSWAELAWDNNGYLYIDPLRLSVPARDSCNVTPGVPGTTCIVSSAKGWGNGFWASLTESSNAFMASCSLNILELYQLNPINIAPISTNPRMEFLFI
ncbi:hypothetical protein SDC9_72684 [bioreactor metagenome]|uniref:Uncharacterized protein n=1 Tax=bioreactor metagenome TaxID=1076179 RepID=A0A644YI78_9ZZZZ